jgi:hypothetical protein
VIRILSDIAMMARQPLAQLRAARNQKNLAVFAILS